MTRVNSVNSELTPSVASIRDSTEISGGTQIANGSCSMLGRLAALCALAACAGCVDADAERELEVGGSGELVVIAGAPESGKLVPRAGVVLDPTPIALASLGGVAAVGTESGVLASQLGADELVEIPVHPDHEGPKDTGAVRLLRRRAGDGLLALADNGLFHSAAGYLLASPLSSSLDVERISWLHARGSGAEEEIWIVSEDGSFWLADGKLTKFSLKDVSSPLTLAIGTEPARAVVAAGDRAFLVDMKAEGAIELARDLGKIEAGDAEEDGSVHLATGAGILSRTRDGELSLRTLAPEAEPGKRVISIASAFGQVVALSEIGMLAIDSGVVARVGDSTPDAGSLAIDANGDAWALEDGKLHRYETGKPVSFKSDVAPFFQAHCQSCHAGGASTAPDHDFTDYESAKEWSETIVRRLQATDATTMPPPNNEVLTAADYAVVLRWVKGGLLP